MRHIYTVNLWARSDGRCLLGLLKADGLESFVARRLGCALRRRISSLTDGSCKSRRIMAFGTYHRASVIKLRTFD
jgi:hypothetical protein